MPDVQPWTPILARGFRAHFRQLRLNPTQAMLLHELIDRLVESRPPPKVRELSIYLGVTTRAVRENLRQLELCGYLKREQTSGRPNAYHYDGLIIALELAISGQ